MITILKKIMEQCDGVRCDMAMLPVRSVFMKTWGDRYRQSYNRDPPNMKEFWEVAIPEIKLKNKNFIFIAEVYWNMEGELMRQGFDYCYDKALYDNLKHGHIDGVRDMIMKADFNFQMKTARFLENHDEDRAVAVFNDKQHIAAAALTFTSLGLKFFHMGQFEGRRERIPMQRGKNTLEGPQELSMGIYQRLIQILKSPAIRNGTFHILNVRPANEGGQDHLNIIAYIYIYMIHPILQ